VSRPNFKVKSYEKNRDQRLTYQKDYYHKHKEARAQYGRVYRDTNKEKIAGWNHEYYSEHKTKLKQQRKAYQKNHQEKISKWKRDYQRANKQRLEEYLDAYAEQRKEKLLAKCAEKKEEIERLLGITKPVDWYEVKSYRKALETIPEFCGGTKYLTLTEILKVITNQRESF
jgi:hypothetical protein